MMPSVENVFDGSFMNLVEENILLARIALAEELTHTQYCRFCSFARTRVGDYASPRLGYGPAFERAAGRKMSDDTLKKIFGS